MASLSSSVRPYLITLATTGLMFVSTNAEAINLSQPSYTHVSMAYTNSNNSHKGFYFNGEFELEHKTFVTATYQTSRYRRQGVSTSDAIIDMGLGKYFTIADGITWDASFSLGRYTPRTNIFSTGTNFYTLNTGIRNKFDAFETRVGYHYVKFRNLSADHGFTASAWYYFTPQMSMGVTYNNVYSGSNWGFGTRILF